MLQNTCFNHISRCSHLWRAAQRLRQPAARVQELIEVIDNQLALLVVAHHGHKNLSGTTRRWDNLKEEPAGRETAPREQFTETHGAVTTHESQQITCSSWVNPDAPRTFALRIPVKLELRWLMWMRGKRRLPPSRGATRVPARIVVSQNKMWMVVNQYTCTTVHSWTDITHLPVLRWKASCTSPQVWISSLNLSLRFTSKDLFVDAKPGW